MEFRYEDQLQKRTFLPYIVFESTKEKILVGGYQTSKEGKIIIQPEWRLFEVANINSLSFVDTNLTFKPDPIFSSFDAEYGFNVPCAVDRV